MILGFWRDLRCFYTFVFTAFLLTTLPLHAETIERYETTKNGLRLEITAPNPNIIRVRAGRDNLPENASWAVLPKHLIATTALDLHQTTTHAILRTASVAVFIDLQTLNLRIETIDGKLILDDAKGAGLSFDSNSGGYRLRKAMPEDAHYFGLGDKVGPLDRRNQAFSLWNKDAYGFSDTTDPLYKSIPFVLSANEAGLSFGFLLDNTWRTAFDFGKAARNELTITAEGGPADYYVLAGPTPKDVVKQYAWLTGTSPLTPLWALGFQQSRYSYETQAIVNEIAKRLRDDHIPSDVIYLDIDFQDRNRPFTIDTKAFPDMGKLVSDLKAQNLKLVLITDLHIAAAPNQGYAPFDTGMTEDIFVRRADGQPYIGVVWPGDSLFPDFSRQKARDWWGTQYKDFVALGIAGFWNDMNEPAVFKVREGTMPLDNIHRIEQIGFTTRDASHAEMHNVYGMLNSKATYEGLLKLTPNTRPFVLTRATYAGGQRYAATWTGDNSSSWGHLTLANAMISNLGLSGFAYSGDDIGGFAGAASSPDLLTRWYEIGAFNPIFRSHAGKKKPAQEVWVDGPEHTRIRRHYIEERYRLMPYIYALAEENSRNGMPIQRPVFLEFPSVLSKGKLGGTGTQFMLGGDFLIAPAPVGELYSPKR